MVRLLTQPFQRDRFINPAFSEFNKSNLRTKCVWNSHQKKHVAYSPSNVTCPPTSHQLHPTNPDCGSPAQSYGGVCINEKEVDRVWRHLKPQCTILVIAFQTTPRNNPDYLWETSMEKTDDVEMLAVENLNLVPKPECGLMEHTGENCERHRKDGNAPLIWMNWSGRDWKQFHCF